jgi:hypothetical protein
MVRKRILTVLIVLILLSLGVQTVSAFSLIFKVESSSIDLYINPDGTSMVDYTYVFVNDPSGDVIDAVDVGVPTNKYNLSNVKADVNGSPVTDIVDSPYVKPGIALNLHSMQIGPGKRGTVHVTISNIQDMIYKTNKVENVQEPYASFQFTPNSFGSQYTSGKTNVTVTLHLPAGLKAEEPRYFTPQGWPGNADPETGFDDQGRVYYRWNSPQADSSTQYVFGGAFPARLVPASALVTESPVNISDSTFSLVCPWIFCAGFFGFIGLVLFGSINADKKRRLQYLPPKISLEGNGIKRGLTAVEAGILMEQPLDKILSMILFSTIKKGAAQVVSKDPLKIEKIAAAGLDLREYEVSFLDAMTSPDKAAVTKGLQKMMVDLVNSISEKMRGFSRRETIAYYQDIMKKAWEQVEAAGTPEVQMQRFDEAMDWTMLDKNFADRSLQRFGRGPVFVPIWWGRYDPGFGRSSMNIPSGPTQVGQAPSGMKMPSLPGADFAASIAGGVQNFSTNVIGNITSFTSGVTNATNPVPVVKSTYSGRSGGGGGGRSCACACACAGCACACAGGGR